jgi:hypothetical protein
MTPLPKSLRLRLVLGLSLTMCLIWGGVAAWQFTNMQRELRTMRPKAKIGPRPSRSKSSWFLACPSAHLQ